MAGIIHPNLSHFTQPLEQRLWEQVGVTPEMERPLPVEEVIFGAVPYVLGAVVASVVVLFLTLAIGPDAALINSPALCRLVALMGLVGFTGIIVVATVSLLMRLVSRKTNDVQAFSFAALFTCLCLITLRAMF
jgi:hypothetical protein